MGSDPPEKIFVSAGFDAHREDGDPWITGRLMKLTDRRAGGRSVSCPEGGCALARSVAAHPRLPGEA
jgi:acetoin utilization deacetylase AcuC-like enzyme